ncbi:DUF4153 domain-containing protein [Marinisporobacter balticus]|uniref:Uncharacterized protein DUF4153 n=1 Tax=Marinisporobacter balticus TaxID=2018667 RepID=A0A4R2KN30_9FIRM|nr:DUF4153 domain-containing protein [Marinisporobacter balticus]TCO72196.1 uncharacterized protein DUF4153 [Marinisporobacter balticus]
MRRLKEILASSIKGISLAGFRFPMTVVNLLSAASIIFRLIAIDEVLSMMLQKLIFTFVVGAVLGMVAQFVVERFHKLSGKRVLVYGVASLFLAGYFLILLPAPEISAEITIRSFVAVFALVCMVLWIPPYKSEVNFNLVALVHFKSIFTSVLYSAVLSAGIAAIIGTIDILLFKVNDDTYAYTMTVIWVVFAPVYYLSLLPRFNSESEADQSIVKHASSYPKSLDILVSNIAIPLISVYTLVLIAYFVKILFTLTWPFGQVGPMVLIYSIAGLLIFVLSSLLENRFVLFYRKIFPKILIPVVIMQLISVGIRLNTYGVTESRYYIAIFGVFSIIVGALLSFSTVSKNGRIALLAAAFAIISIIPPVDAFTVSRRSQINRIQSILENEGMLIDGKIIKKEDASEYTKVETTNILYYLERSSSLEYIDWLPEDFTIYHDFKATFGYKPTYPTHKNGDQQYINVSLDTQQPLLVSGYDVLLNTFVGRYMNEKEMKDFDFELNGKMYRLKVNRIPNDEVRVSILDSFGTELVGTDLNKFAKGIVGEETNVTKEVLPLKEMSFDVIKNEYKLKIIFQNISYASGRGSDSGADYAIYVLFAAYK